MFRALQIAHKNGLIGAEGIAANSPREMLPNNMLREFFAEIKFLFSRPNTPLPMPAAGVRHVADNLPSRLAFHSDGRNVQQRPSYRKKESEPSSKPPCVKEPLRMVCSALRVKPR